MAIEEEPRDPLRPTLLRTSDAIEQAVATLRYRLKCQLRDQRLASASETADQILDLLRHVTRP